MTSDRSLPHREGEGWGCCLTYDHRHSRLDDACFLGSYLREGVAEELLVVEADIGNDREVGHDDIGAVEATAETYFNDSNINLLFCKVEKGECGGQLKEEGCSGSKKARSCSTKSMTRCSGIISPFTRMRSRKSTRCGEV